MKDISLLPEEARKREQALPPSRKSQDPGGLKMHIPEADVDEDIEIIEVDEGDLGSVLADEPFFTRFMYRASALVEKVRRQLLQKKDDAPPPKLPPQFFTPPRSGAAGTARLPPGAAGALAGRGGATQGGTAGGSKARIMPSADVPRRVRVIKRVRKPVQVSLISEEDVMAYRIDVPRRQWTLAVMTLLFIALAGGGYWFLGTRITNAQTVITELDRQLRDTDQSIVSAEVTWSDYRDLQRRLTVLGQLLDSHAVLSRAFDVLERRTLPTVAFRSATLSTDSRLSLDAVADSYETAAQQLVAFQTDPSVQSVESLAFAAQIDAETGVSNLVTFQLLIDLNPSGLRGSIVESSSP